MRHLFSLLGLLLMPLTAFLQTQAPIEVAQLTLRVGAGDTEELCYGFAEGDRILISVEETEGKIIKSVSLLEYPETIRLLEEETGGFLDRVVNVTKRGVFCLRIQNGGLMSERLCRVSIRRIPGNEKLAKFNTQVQWVERVDTVYKSGGKELSGYQVQSVEKTRKVLVKADTQAVTLLERTERIYSKAGFLYGDQSTNLQFTLPLNKAIPDTRDPNETTEVISWVYWIGVGDEADRSYQQANAKALSKLADAAISLRLVATGGYGALALLAVKGVALFTNPPKGDNVHYQLLRIQANGKHEVMDKGSSIMTYRRMEKPLQGTFAFQLTNDNYVDGINVTIKVLAVTLNRTYRTERYTETTQERIEDPDLLGKAVIKVVKVPILGGQQ